MLEAGFSISRGNFPQQGYNRGHNQPYQYRARSNSQHRDKGKKERARAKGKSDGAQVQQRPLLNLGNATLGQTILPNPIPLINVTSIFLEREINRNQTFSFKPQFLGPRNCLQAWKDLGPPKLFSRLFSQA